VSAATNQARQQLIALAHNQTLSGSVIVAGALRLALNPNYLLKPSYRTPVRTSDTSHNRFAFTWP
jgi:hypothetical protein